MTEDKLARFEEIENKSKSRAGNCMDLVRYYDYTDGLAHRDLQWALIELREAWAIKDKIEHDFLNAKTGLSLTTAQNQKIREEAASQKLELAEKTEALKAVQQHSFFGVMLSWDKNKTEEYAGLHKKVTEVLSKWDRTTKE